MGQQHERLALDTLRRRPTTPPRARAPACRPGSRRPRPRRRRRAPSVPAHVASHAARRPASQRPSPSRTTHSAATSAARRPRRGAAPSAPAGARARDRRRGARWPTSRAATPSWLGEPRSRSAATAASAAAVSAAPGSNGSSRQRAVTCRAPGAAGEDAERVGRQVKDGRAGYIRRRRLGSARSRMARRARNHWGWGYEDEQPLGARELREAAAGSARAPRLRRAGAGASRCRWTPPRCRRRGCPAAGRARRDLRRDDADERARHAYGSAYRDVVRGFRGRLDHAPDFVARPRDEARRRGACSRGRAGASAAVDPVRRRDERRRRRRGARSRAATPARSRSTSARSTACSRSTRSRARRASRPARSGRGSRSSSRAHGLTLRHFPQSFELSTLGGWIATRAGGHFATRPDARRRPRRGGARDHAGAAAWESRRLPGSGAGPSPDRLLLGSEGDARRDHRGVGARAAAARRTAPRAPCASPTSRAGAEAVRALAQSGLHPSNCRLLDAREAALTFAGDGSHALLVLGVRVDGRAASTSGMRAALEICARARRRVGRRAAAPAAARSALARGVPARALPARRARRAGRAGRDLRDGDHLGALRRASHAAVTAATRAALARAAARGDRAASRTSIPTGRRRTSPCSRPARRGDEVAQWDAIKRAAGDAILAGGGTITHHHAVGRDHRPWYDRQRPEPFAAALRGAKAAVDPAGLMNPGVLIELRRGPASALPHT